MSNETISLAQSMEAWAYENWQSNGGDETSNPPPDPDINYWAGFHDGLVALRQYTDMGYTADNWLSRFKSENTE
jgi:hypothetical protein